MNVAQSFAKLITRIQPTAAEVNSAKQHLATIGTRLETVFEVSSCRVTGSFGRNSSIHGFSDTELFAVFRKAQFTWGGNIISSTRALENVRQQLLARYPNTPLGRDGMAITINFSDGQVVDVVPALFDSMFKEKWPIYLIPDGLGGWMRSCPSLYDAYRYAWAERAKVCGYPERFAQEALGHNSKAVHRAYDAARVKVGRCLETVRELVA